MYNRKDYQSKSEWLAKKQAINERQKEIKNKIRDSLSQDTADYLRRGGKIKKFEIKEGE